MRIIFMGTPEFGLPALKAIDKDMLVAVVTQPDRKIGRGQKIGKSPVKIWAEENDVPILQPEKISTPAMESEIRSLRPDIIITAAYGQLLATNILEIPSYGCINIHASLLPLYRGASPINQAILNNDEKSGITIMYMERSMDTGAIILQKDIPITADDTAGSLHDKLSVLASEMIGDAINLFDNGPAPAIVQDHEKATYCKKITKEMALIDFNRTYTEIDCHVRGFQPWPNAYTNIDGKRIIVLKVEKADGDYEVGKVACADSKDGLIIGCTDGGVKLTTIKPAGKPAMDAAAWLLGNKIDIGTLAE